MAAAKLSELITANPVVIFGWTKCPFCKKAKELILPLYEPTKVVELDTMGAEGDELKGAIEKEFNYDTVPVIFISGKLVGGYSEVADLHQNGKLNLPSK